MATDRCCAPRRRFLNRQGALKQRQRVRRAVEGAHHDCLGGEGTGDKGMVGAVDVLPDGEGPLILTTRRFEVTKAGVNEREIKDDRGHGFVLLSECRLADGEASVVESACGFVVAQQQREAGQVVQVRRDLRVTRSQPPLGHRQRLLQQFAGAIEVPQIARGPRQQPHGASDRGVIRAEGLLRRRQRVRCRAVRFLEAAPREFLIREQRQGFDKFRVRQVPRTAQLERPSQTIARGVVLAFRLQRPDQYLEATRLCTGILLTRCDLEAALGRLDRLVDPVGPFQCPAEEIECLRHVQRRRGRRRLLDRQRPRQQVHRLDVRQITDDLRTVA